MADCGQTGPWADCGHRGRQRGRSANNNALVVAKWQIVANEGLGRIVASESDGEADGKAASGRMVGSTTIPASLPANGALGGPWLVRPPPTDDEAIGGQGDRAKDKCPRRGEMAGRGQQGLGRNVAIKTDDDAAGGWTAKWHIVANGALGGSWPSRPSHIKADDEAAGGWAAGSTTMPATWANCRSWPNRALGGSWSSRKTTVSHSQQPCPRHDQMADRGQQGPWADCGR